MPVALSRKAESLRRILFLCADNYHESRFCEELFNSHARTEGLYWQATSRAMWPEPAKRNEGPMALCAIEALRELGAAPVNHLRLPLPVGDFDVRMSSTVVVIGEPGPVFAEHVAAYHTTVVERWPGSSRGTHSQADLLRLARDLSELIASVRYRPVFQLDHGAASVARGHGIAC